MKIKYVKEQQKSMYFILYLRMLMHTHILIQNIHMHRYVYI